MRVSFLVVQVQTCMPSITKVQRSEVVYWFLPSIDPFDWVKISVVLEVTKN